MAERMPLAYPNLETSQINFSLPLRLAHKRSMSLLPVHSSTQHTLGVSSTRPRAASAPVGLAYASNPTFVQPPGSDSTPSPTFLDRDRSSNLQPRAASYSPTNRRTPPRLQLKDKTRLRASSVSTTTSSLEATLAELEELIEVLSTPIPLDAEFFSAQTKTGTEAEIEYSKVTCVAPISAHDEPSPEWI
ncbi:hypothetical protein V565_084580 [Rhizoctonia solani 123E]|uniref:Uncharacterized protein n=1 Tax=Rhizoctonia solani 123E TaxID=1423351 RepID=A0A074SJP8_9AGAM|nr:hypothetical protein V565_084580 [Rhizoctonia solani 123E]